MARVTDLPAELLAKVFTNNGLTSRDLASAALATRAFTSEATRAAFLYNISHEQSSVLVWAARNGRMNQMRRALSMGANPNTHGMTEEELARVWEWNGECVFEREEFGTPLHYAALHGQNEMVLLLLRNGAQMDSLSLHLCNCVENCHVGMSFDIPQASLQWYPLHHAVCQGHVSTANILLDHGAPLETSYCHGGLPSPRKLLHCAAARGLPTLVQRALAMGADASGLSICKDSALHFTSESWDSGSVIQILLEAGAPLEADQSQHGLTPISGACELSNFSTAMHLLKAGANTDFSFSLLHRAVEVGHNADWDIRPQPHSDRDREQVDFVRALIKNHGFDVDEVMVRPTELGYRRVTPLCCSLDLEEPRARSIEQLNPDLAILLLEKGANPNHASRGYPVPLEYALRHFLSLSQTKPNNTLLPKLRRLINVMMDCGARFSAVDDDVRYDVEAEAKRCLEGDETTRMLRRLLHQPRKQASAQKASSKKSSSKKK
ncbi:hypothetical protein diail_554 [Diaporthe ilicicola]|nr:hypothetical protein diail_554 [Diaporthe ilicicola]